MEHTQWRYKLHNLQGSVSIATRTKVATYWKDTTFVPDHHRFYYILEGEGEITVDGKTYYPKQGDLVLMPSGVPQSYRTISDYTYLKYWCHFTAHIGSISLFQWVKGPVLLSLNATDQAAIEALFEELLSAHKRQHWTASIQEKANLFRLIHFYLQRTDHEDTPTQTEEGEKLAIVFAYIEKHLHEKVTVSQLADLLHFHPNYFIRFFHNQVGLSPIQFMLQAKLDKGKECLTHSDASISEIAEQLAMEPHYFSRVFKKKVGLSPSEYRQVFLGQQRN
ncbi:AraC family transcriptional regulator [Aureibacillus halotolerans]|uniref:AraC-like protein n=1 Tax=Aureibacillus halotolerans TaxID=1508390 RepID=A0A4R6U2N4_9BACI|nr:AraC family transcriptional regulator [Aureibacillus halotolerans]TDQ38699.1 AraC-like protein [Aureibacillus halotolerans]